MCTNGVNSGQLKSSVTQIDEAVALTRRWTHRAYHLADDAKFAGCAAKLEAAQKLLDDVRALLDEAGDIIDKEDSQADSTTVTLV